MYHYHFIQLHHSVIDIFHPVLKLLTTPILLKDHPRLWHKRTITLLMFLCCSSYNIFKLYIICNRKQKTMRTKKVLSIWYRLTHNHTYFLLIRYSWHDSNKLFFANVPTSHYTLSSIFNFYGLSHLHSIDVCSFASIWKVSFYKRLRLVHLLFNLAREKITLNKTPLLCNCTSSDDFCKRNNRSISLWGCWFWYPSRMKIMLTTRKVKMMVVPIKIA